MEKSELTLVEETMTNKKEQSTDLAKQDEVSVGMMSLIAKAASDPNVDVEKMQAMLSMQERIIAKQAEIDFNQAMTRLMPKMPVIHKKGKIEFVDKNNHKRETPFARYEDIDEAIRPHLIAEGFSLSFDTEWLTDGVKIVGTLSHSGGHSRTSSMRLPLDVSGSKNNLQAAGSTITYGKRYLVGMLLNIVTKDEDDDGQAADEVITLEQAAEIDQLMSDVSADKDGFLKYMGVDDVRDILSKHYNKAINALNAKKRKAQ